MSTEQEETEMCAVCRGQCTTSEARCTCGAASASQTGDDGHVDNVFRIPSLMSRSSKKKRKSRMLQGASPSSASASTTTPSTQQSSEIFRGRDPPLPLPQMQALLGDRLIDVRTWAMMQTRHRILDNLAAAPNEEAKRATVLRLTAEVDELNPPSPILNQIVTQILATFYPADYYRRLQQRTPRLPPQQPQASSSTATSPSTPTPPQAPPPAQTQPNLEVQPTISLQAAPSSALHAFINPSTPLFPMSFEPSAKIRKVEQLTPPLLLPQDSLQTAGQPLRMGDLRLASPQQVHSPVVSSQYISQVSSLDPSLQVPVLLPQALLPQFIPSRELSRVLTSTPSLLEQGNPADVLFRNELANQRALFLAQQSLVPISSELPVVTLDPSSFPSLSHFSQAQSQDLVHFAYLPPPMFPHLLKDWSSFRPSSPHNLSEI